jgi:hypothetical protein
MASFMLVVLSKQKLGDEPFLIFFHVEAPQVTGSSKAVQPQFPLIMLTAFILASVHLAHSQQPKKVPRIGYLTTRSGPEAGEKAFLQGLQSLGYIEGQTIAIEWRFAQEKFDRLPELANELVGFKKQNPPNFLWSN